MNDTDQLPGLPPLHGTVTKLRERIEINQQRKALTAAQQRPTWERLKGLRASSPTEVGL